VLTIACALSLRGIQVASPVRGPAMPDELLSVALRNVGQLWLLVNLVAGLLAALMLGVMQGPQWLNGAIDTAQIMWLISALIAAWISGLMLLFAPGRRTGPWSSAWIGRVVTGTGVVAALIAAWLLDVWLDSSQLVAALHKWVLLPILTAGVVGATLSGVLLHGRLGSAATRPIGIFLLCFSTITLVRVVGLIANYWQGSPMVFVLAGLVTSCLACLRGGGMIWLRQQVIRALLRREPTSPGNLIALLEDAENRGLLQRAGAGFLFTHLAIQRFLAR
jgi:hypothetical protein